MVVKALAHGWSFSCAKQRFLQDVGSGGDGGGSSDNEDGTGKKSAKKSFGSKQDKKVL